MDIDKWKAKMEPLSSSESMLISSMEKPPKFVKAISWFTEIWILRNHWNFVLIILSELNNKDEGKVIDKKAIVWSIADIKGISSLYIYTYKEFI